MEILLEHVRSFSKLKKVPLRPLTLLVGENSSGKSTFLSVVSSVLNTERFPANPGFNEAPYNLGTFDTIATYRGGKYGRDETFSIGFALGKNGEKGFRRATATFGSDYGNVGLRLVHAENGSGTLDLNFENQSLGGEISFRGDETSVKFQSKMTDTAFMGQQPFNFAVMNAIFDTQQRKENWTKTLNRIHEVIAATVPPFSDSYSFAPIRSKPKRTYDELAEEYSPEGDHIPTLLARLLRQESRSNESQRVQKALVRFGKESGLFNSINVKKLGQKMTDPFQLQVSGAGPSVNLTDVGYGVSQALPIVVQSVLKSSSKVLLMQQPEVHLHPRAQAALGSFFSELVAKDRMLVVETHSDYLLDRVRQEVAAGHLSPDEVLILFFHKPKLETEVHPIYVDSNGNIEDAPDHYRDFFLSEEFNLISRTEK
jgi:energy-coupling factor transporter ATP-binding protein EcfA2